MKHDMGVALCSVICAAGIGSAHAQSTVTVYGAIDLSVDRIGKGEGNVQGTVFGLSGTKPVPNAIASPESKTIRVAPSLTQQSHLGFKGKEELGNGYASGFTLEAGFVADTGQVANDGRIFGRQAFVSLTTPYGEVRLGRQATPMLIGYYIVSTEKLGTTDFMGAGLLLDNTQIYQDNVIEYIARRGPWLAAMSYSPNAGVASRISAARASAVGTVPAANQGTGQIIGGASAGAETADRRGHAEDALIAYAGSDLSATFAYHRVDLGGATVGLATSAGGGSFIPLYNAERAQGAMLGVKYTLPSTNTTIAAVYHVNRYELGGSVDPLVRSATIGVRQQFGQFSLIADVLSSKFANFTKGRMKGAMAGVDYHLSKRTAIYTRAGYAQDYRGNTVVANLTPLPLAGGPGALLVPLGTQEIPLFSGAGQNIDARTTLFSLGLRHAF